MQSEERKILFIVWFVLLPIYLFAQQQQIDSFKNELKKTRNHYIKLKLLDTISTLMLYNGDDSKEQIVYFTNMLALAKELKKPKKEHQALKNLANHYLHQSDFSKAENYALQSLQVATNKQLHIEKMLSYSLLGRIYNHFDLYEQSLTYYLLSVKIFTNQLTEEEKNNHLYFMSTLYANMAIVYRNTQNDSLTDLYNIKSFELAKKLKDYMRMSQFYATQGWLYFSIDNYEQAEKYFQKALQDSAKIRLKIYNIAAQHGLGTTYAAWGKCEQAIAYNTRVLAYFTKTKNYNFVSAVAAVLSAVYAQRNELKKAKNFAEKALHVGEQINSPKHIISAKLALATVYLKQKKQYQARQILNTITSDSVLTNNLNWKQSKRLYLKLSGIENKDHNYIKAFEYSMLYNQFKDSIQQRKLSNFSNLVAKHKFAEKRQELKIKEKELKIQQNKKEQLWLYLTLLVALGIFLTSIFTRYYMRSKHYKAELKDTLLEIKKIKAQLFSIDILQSKQASDFKQKDFKSYLMLKYNIEKNEIIDVWESISNGVSRSEYAEKTKISENTIKTWRNELYSILKKADFSTARYSDYKAVVTYYNNLVAYKSLKK